MRAARSRPVRSLALVAAGALLLAACSSSTASVSAVRDQNDDVPFTGCDQVECSGTLNGAQYEIRMPEKWNGTLLLWSHGYRPADPWPPEFTPVDTSAEWAPGANGDTASEVATALLDRGYALAGSSYSRNGWAVEEGVGAANDIYQFFTDKIATPNRVYAWGASEGGLITQEIAETHPDWVDGVAPLCGAVAGVVPNFDVALDATYSFKTLIWPEMKLTGYTSLEEASQVFAEAVKRGIEAAQDVEGGGTAKILTIASVVDAPTKSRRFDGANPVSSVSAIMEALGSAFGLGIMGRYDVESKYGGNISGNADVDYLTRLSDEDKELIDAVGGTGAAEEYVQQLEDGTRVVADPAAREKAFAEGGNPQGWVTDPTITLHTAYDTLVLVQNETFLLDRYRTSVADGRATSELVQTYTTPPGSYPEDPGAPYGAGHCNFTTDSYLAVVDLLDSWVRDGVYPGPAALTAAFGEDNGFNALFVPGPWPEPAAVTEGEEE